MDWKTIALIVGMAVVMVVMVIIVVVVMIMFRRETCSGGPSPRRIALNPTFSNDIVVKHRWMRTMMVYVPETVETKGTLPTNPYDTPGVQGRPWRPSEHIAQTVPTDQSLWPANYQLMKKKVRKCCYCRALFAFSSI